MSEKPTRAQLTAHIRAMAQQSRVLAAEYDEWAARFEAEPLDEPDMGHTWRLIVLSRSSSKVVGDEHHKDAPEFDPLPQTVEVRAWNLRDALAKAAALPLSVWFTDETDVDTGV